MRKSILLPLMLSVLLVFTACASGSDLLAEASYEHVEKTNAAYDFDFFSLYGIFDNHMLFDRLEADELTVYLLDLSEDNIYTIGTIDNFSVTTASTSFENGKVYISYGIARGESIIDSSFYAIDIANRELVKLYTETYLSPVIKMTSVSGIPAYYCFEGDAKDIRSKVKTIDTEAKTAIDMYDLLWNAEVETGQSILYLTGQGDVLFALVGSWDKEKEAYGLQTYTI